MVHACSGKTSLTGFVELVEKQAPPPVNMLYKAAMQEAAELGDKEPSVHVPHPYQVALGIICLQQVMKKMGLSDRNSSPSLSLPPSLSLLLFLSLPPPLPLSLSQNNLSSSKITCIVTSIRIFSSLCKTLVAKIK